MKTTLKIKGGPQLLRELGALEQKVEKRIGKKAIRAGGTEYAKLVRRKIPMDSEDNVHLKRSIAVASLKGAKMGRAKNKIAVQVGVKGPARYYAHIYEYGSKFHQGTGVFTKTLKSSTRQIFERIKYVLTRELAKL